jgi:AraC-like DNA-binding protein
VLDILSQFSSLPAQGVTCTDHGELLDLHVDLARAGLGKGMLAHQFDGETLLSLANARFDHSHRLRVEVPDDVLFVRASLGASTDYRVGDAATWRFRRPEVTVSAVPRGATIDIDVHAQVSVLSMSLMFRPRTLVERHRIALRELPAPMRDLVEGSLAAPVLMATLPIGADVAALVRDLAHSRLTGSLRRTQLQARSAELLVLVAAVWRERLGHESWPGARPRDAELLAAARRVLAERFAHPPTLAELSTLLGTNKNKINQLFRAQLQVTPQAYCMRLRVERAQALIAQGCMNLAEVAEAVGYQHQSSFTEAFRQVTGMPPGRYAQMARQASQAGRALQ